MKHCKPDAGFSGLKDVSTGEKDDVQESFFFAETLKYFYHVLNKLAKLCIYHI